MSSTVIEMLAVFVVVAMCGQASSSPARPARQTTYVHHLPRGQQGFPSQSTPDAFSSDAFNLPEYAAAIASNSAASLVANKMAADANSAAQLALASAAQNQAKSSLITKAAHDAQHAALAEASLAAEAGRAAEATEKTYALLLQISKLIARLTGETTTGLSDSWTAMQSARTLQAGQEAMALKAQRTANMLARRQTRSQQDLETANEALFRSKLAANRAQTVINDKASRKRY